MLRAELAIMNDDPGSNGRGMTILGDVEGKIALVLENGIGSGQWFARAAEELAERGAASVYSCATHAASTVGAAERLARSPLDRILVTDTVPIHESLESSRLEVLSVAGSSPRRSQTCSPTSRSQRSSSARTSSSKAVR